MDRLKKRTTIFARLAYAASIFMILLALGCFGMLIFMVFTWEACSGGYCKRFWRVMYRYQITQTVYRDLYIDGVDIDTFSSIGNGNKPFSSENEHRPNDYAKDKNRVYFYSKAIDRADPDTFDASNYALLPLVRDKNSVYYEWQRLDGIDPASAIASRMEGVEGAPILIRDKFHSYRLEPYWQRETGTYDPEPDYPIYRKPILTRID